MVFSFHIFNLKDLKKGGREGEKEEEKREKMRSVLVGIVIAFVLLIVIFPLLASSDRVFAAIFENYIPDAGESAYQFCSCHCVHDPVWDPDHLRRILCLCCRRMLPEREKKEGIMKQSQA